MREVAEGTKNLRPGSDLDAVDLRIITELQANGRVTNAELAERVGIAASTCITRVRSLVSRQVISGFTAIVNPREMGFGLEVLVNVAVHAAARGQLLDIAAELEAMPGVMQVFFLGGGEDFIIHLAARDSDDVRDFVTEHLSSNPAVSSTRTNLIFSHHQNPIGPQ